MVTVLREVPGDGEWAVIEAVFGEGFAEPDDFSAKGRSERGCKAS